MSKAAGRHTLLGNKAGSTRLSLAVPLKLFQAEDRFLRRPGDVPIATVKALASQVGVPAAARQGYDWRGRTIEPHCTQIRDALGFRRRVGAERLHELRRHPDPILLTPLARRHCPTRRAQDGCLSRR